MKKPPSIFNDVIGPVMVGPSSSHCAAAVRIGRLARDLMGGEVASVVVEFHPQGSLATTHESQGSDMGLFGGLMGWETSDERLADSARHLAGEGIRVEVVLREYPATHPNTYRMRLDGPGGCHTLTALSTGGGMVEVVEVDGVPLLLSGDAYETLAFVEPGRGGEVLQGSWMAKARPRLQLAEVREKGEVEILRLRGRDPLPEQVLAGLGGTEGVRTVRVLAPVLPVTSPGDFQVPFLSAEELLGYNRDRNLALWELALLYEGARGGMERGRVLEMMGDVVRRLERSVEEGLAGTEYEDRILGPQARRYLERLDDGGEPRLLDGGILNQIVPRVTALMEVKSAMGVIVAAPTAGACGALPGVLLGAAHAMDLDRGAVAKAMLAAGLVGVFIAARSTFAAEVCGCQAETGAGGGMAAAGLVTLAGGGVDEALAAASMALQNTLGMVCDPVANRVEVPCLGRNVLAGANALASANMALAGFDPVIPLDEVIDTMDSVGKALPRTLRCTALGGLSITPTSRKVKERLEGEG